MTKVDMYGCHVWPDEKLVIVYQNSYLSDKMREQLIDDGYTIVKGIALDRYGNEMPPPSLPLQSFDKTANEEVKE